MRNLKKFLALTLSVMMVLGLMLTANAAPVTGYSDENGISDDYLEAVAVLEGMGVMEGEGEDTFNPKGTFTRAQLAGIAYRVTGHDSSDKADLFVDYGPFTDLAGSKNEWATGYINYAWNADWVHGVNAAQTLYEPDSEVTGYQVLALLLQIMGYGKDGEFIGSNWRLMAGRWGDAAGITDTLTETTLNRVATREEVAELVFQALQAYMVDYNEITRTYRSTGVTLGEFYYGLDSDVLADTWGRPVTVWYDARLVARGYTEFQAAYATIDLPLLAEFTEKVDECDVAEEAGITGYRDIVAYYVDGVGQPIADATSDGCGDINAVHTTSVMGGHGTILEVYRYSSTRVWVTEINTYLAKVTDVVEAETDKNGHPSPRTIDIEVYVDADNSDDKAVAWTRSGIENDEFVKGQYILVNLASPATASDTSTVFASSTKIKLVSAAPALGSGSVEDWDTGYGTDHSTHTISGNVYNDSEKFFLNLHDATDTLWIVYGDGYGHAIGLGQSSSSYALILDIEFKNSTDSIRNGYVLANLLLGDGTVLEDVTIDLINGKTIINGDAEGKPNANPAEVSDSADENGDYYGHLFTYSQLDNGHYSLGKSNHKASSLKSGNGNTDTLDRVRTVAKPVVDMENVTLTSTSQYLTGDVDFDTGTPDVNIVDDIVINSNTVFFVYNYSTGGYDVYHINSLPTLTGATVCVLYNDNDYAEIVVVESYTRTMSSVLYFYEKVPAAVNKGGTDYWRYNALLVANGTVTKVRVDIVKTGITGWTNTAGITTNDTLTADTDATLLDTGVYSFTNVVDSGNNIYTVSSGSATKQKVGLGDSTSNLASNGVASAPTSTSSPNYDLGVVRSHVGQTLNIGTIGSTAPGGVVVDSTVNKLGYKAAEDTTYGTRREYRTEDTTFVLLTQANSAADGTSLLGTNATKDITSWRTLKASEVDTYIKEGAVVLVSYSATKTDITSKNTANIVFVYALESSNGSTTTPEKTLAVIDGATVLPEIGGGNALTTLKMLADGVYQINENDKSEIVDMAGAAASNLIFKFMQPTTVADFSFMITDSTGKLMYMETHATGDFSGGDKAYYIYVQVIQETGVAFWNAGSGPMKTKGLTEGVYTYTMQVTGKDPIVGTFEIGYVTAD